MTELTVTRTEPVTPAILRVWFRSDDLSAFADSGDTDRYVKLQFPEAVRTYTALYPDVEAGTLAIDFVVHGDEGVAGPWARRAQPGDRLEARGPGGAYRPDPAADWHLLAGDESAVPAITAALEALPAGAVARVVVLVEDAEHEPALPLPAGAELVLLHRACARAGRGAHHRGALAGLAAGPGARVRARRGGRGDARRPPVPPRRARPGQGPGLDLRLLAARPHRGGLPAVEGRAAAAEEGAGARRRLRPAAGSSGTRGPPRHDPGARAPPDAPRRARPVV